MAPDTMLRGAVVELDRCDISPTGGPDELSTWGASVLAATGDSGDCGSGSRVSSLLPESFGAGDT